MVGIVYKVLTMTARGKAGQCPHFHKTPEGALKCAIDLVCQKGSNIAAAKVSKGLYNRKTRVTIRVKDILALVSDKEYRRRNKT
jgi:hypothetical protein